MGKADAPALSVVVPVHNGAGFLLQSLGALHASDLERSAWELIVVDDGSTDRSGDIARALADQVVTVPPPGRGRAGARNLGAEAARGSVLVFVDADVCVHEDALRRVREALGGETDLCAVFGAYDCSPAAPGLVSQYRNLLHRYVHERDAGASVTFWTGLGAVRRAAFEAAGGFDEQVRLEDVELGYRLSAVGCRIELDPRIQGTHLKRWSLAEIIRTDVSERGVPWMRLLLARRHRNTPRTLNVRLRERVLTGLMGFASLAATAALLTSDPRWTIAAGAALVGVTLGDLHFLSWLGRQRGGAFALRVIPLRGLYYLLNVLSVVLAVVTSWRAAPSHPVPRPDMGGTDGRKPESEPERWRGEAPVV